LGPSEANTTASQEAANAMTPTDRTPSREPSTAADVWPPGFTVSYLINARVLDVAPDDPLVPVTVWHSDPEDADADSVFGGLNPRLAATVVSTYTRPRDLVVDLTNDIALAGVANASTRSYLSLPGPVAEFARLLPALEARADLVLLRWPTPSPARPARPESRRSARRYRDAEIPSPAFGVLRSISLLAGATGHVGIAITRGQDLAAEPARIQPLLAEAHASGLGYLQHLILITSPRREPEPETPSFSRYEAAASYARGFHPLWSRDPEAAISSGRLRVDSLLLILRGRRPHGAHAAAE
jgi:hypothetical protein